MTITLVCEVLNARCKYWLSFVFVVVGVLEGALTYSKIDNFLHFACMKTFFWPRAPLTYNPSYGTEHQFLKELRCALSNLILTSKSKSTMFYGRYDYISSH